MWWTCEKIEKKIPSYFPFGIEAGRHRGRSGTQTNRARVGVSSCCLISFQQRSLYNSPRYSNENHSNFVSWSNHLNRRWEFFKFFLFIIGNGHRQFLCSFLSKNLKFSISRLLIWIVYVYALEYYVVLLLLLLSFLFSMFVFCFSFFSLLICAICCGLRRWHWRHEQRTRHVSVWR